MALEIERKFMVERLPPEVVRIAGAELRQGYLALDGETEVRVRLEPERALLTIKHGGGRSRVEEEVALSHDQAESLWALSEGRRVEKLRRRLQTGELCIEVDEYRGDLAGLLVAEVEFPDEGAAGQFVAPDWFGQEVTDDAAYKNRALACEGVPGAGS